MELLDVVSTVLDLTNKGIIFKSPLIQWFPLGSEYNEEIQNLKLQVLTLKNVLEQMSEEE